MNDKGNFRVFMLNYAMAHHKEAIDLTESQIDDCHERYERYIKRVNVKNKRDYIDDEI